MTLRWEEGYSSVTDILKNLATKITNNLTDTNWNLHYPATIDAIQKTFVIKHTVGTKDVLVEFHQPTESLIKTLAGTLVEKTNYFCIEMSFGTGYVNPISSDQRGTWPDDSSSVPMRMAWFMGNTTTNIKGWLPVHYWMSITEKRIAFVLQGDPAANPDDKLVSFCHIGAIKSFKHGVTDVDGNFGVCCSSDLSPFDYLEMEDLNKFSETTGTGVTDLCMLATLTGFPMQGHKIAQVTPDEFALKKLEGPSIYTQEYHVSPVYIFHPYNGWRGEMEYIISSDRSSIDNLDEMKEEVEEEKMTYIYKMFLLSAPYTVFNNSSNVLHAVGILKEIKPTV